VRVSDLTYSLSALGELGSSLDGLAGQLDGAGRRVDADAAELGHPAVVDALEHFVGNWDDKRELLIRSLTEVGEMASAAEETFRQVDEDLAKEIRSAMEGSCS
jgi:hypothetical protein